jgi:hypothetical protein
MKTISIQQQMQTLEQRSLDWALSKHDATAAAASAVLSLNESLDPKVWLQVSVCKHVTNDW